MKRPTKAIIAAAGFGTRFLPQTKAMPKEMMPLIDKPIIQYVVEELVAAGITDIIIVGSSNKRAIEDHFDEPSADLVANLKAGGAKKKPLYDQMMQISDMANFIYLRQKGVYGNATPVQCAAHLIGNEPFIYTFADDFFVAKPGRTKQLIETYTKYSGQVLACKKMLLDDEYDRYGVVAGDSADDVTIRVSKFVEKPGKADAPSDLASVSGYLLTPEIFAYIDRAALEHNGTGELMIQPIVQQMIDDGYAVYAREITGGTFYDTGDKLEYIKTIIDFGLAHPVLGRGLRQFIADRLSHEQDVK